MGLETRPQRGLHRADFDVAFNVRQIQQYTGYTGRDQ
jgi:hypothetical protein